MISSTAFISVLVSSCILATFSEVITRKSNENEGTVCYLTDKTQGICRPTCPGQKRNTYKNDVCNTGQSPTLYCCTDRDGASKYPTIHRVCAQRILSEEINRRGKIAEKELNSAMNAFKEMYEQRIAMIKRWCYQSSLDREEEERNDFLEQCLTIPKESGLTITGEHPGKPLNYPSAVGIGYKNSGGNVKWECSGTFIHTSYVLTAASCIVKAKQMPNTIRHGLFNISDTRFLNDPAFEYVVQKVTVHEDYIADSLYNDIAILKVDFHPEWKKRRDYKSNWVPAPICLWTKSQPPNTNLTVQGFYSSNSHPTVRSVFYSGNATIVRSVECERLEKYSRSLQSATADYHLCVKEEESDSNVCKGEIGGSVEYNEETWLDVPYLVGVSSYRLPCRQNEPNLYTGIYPYLEWIESVISGGIQ